MGIAFTLTLVPMVDDKNFRITKTTLKLKSQDPENTATFKRRFNLGIQRDWKVSLRGDRQIKALINKKEYNWNLPGNDFKDTKFLDIEIPLKGTQEIRYISCEQTVIIDDNNKDKRKLSDLKSLEAGKKNEEKEENEKIKKKIEEL